jgi:hypothetical protein
MNHPRHFTKLILFAAASLLVLAPFHVYADSIDTTYVFIGQCSDCDGSGGPGVGSGWLTVANYTAGTTLTNSNFVSFDYSSAALAFSIDNLTSLAGMLYADPQTAYVDIQGTTDAAGDTVSFVSTPGGYWCVGNLCGSDQGSNFVWSPAGSIPEPASFIPVATGLFCLALGRRRFGRRSS